MEQWLQHRHIFLDEQLRRDGLGDALNGSGLCSGCSSHPGRFRCKDCSGRFMYCSACIVSSHQRLPLHGLQVSQLSSAALTRVDPISSRGMAIFLKMQPSKASDSPSISLTPTTSAPPARRPGGSLLSTFPATTLSTSGFARVLSPHFWNLIANYLGSIGIPHHSVGPRRPSPSTSWTCITKYQCKGN